MDLSMKRFLSLAVAAVLIAGCGGGGTDDTGGEAADEAEGAGETAGPVVNPDSAGTITGVVSFEGTPPAPEPIDMAEEPTCAEKYTEPPVKEAAVVSGGNLANVYVYVKEGLPDLDFPAPAEGVTLDQTGCHYVPHVLAIQVGQPLVIKNSDGILHNINTQPSQNRGFNISQPVEMETEREFNTAEVMIPVKCDVHGWMEAYIGVQDHPYAAVSGADGTFSLENLPAGDYVIEAWHERFGTQTQNVTVGAGATEEITFTFSGEMAGRPVPLGEPLVLHADHSGVK